MRKSLIIVALLGALNTGQVFAIDCGEVPQDMPSVPDGAKATSDDIRYARSAVLTFSSKVDEYLTCMDNRATQILPYLTKEQQVRWDEDLASIHDKRRELQTQMNTAIRAFRRASQN